MIPNKTEERRAENFGVPWEKAFGYCQAVQYGDTISLSDQFSHDSNGNLVAPAELDELGKPKDFSAMESQMRQTYANAIELLSRFGATLDDVVEESVFVVDIDAAFAVAGKVRKEAYGTDHPKCTSNLFGISRFAFREQLVEVTFRAVLNR